MAVASGRSLANLLENVVTWGERLGRFVNQTDEMSFVGDELLQAAVSKCVEAIGEASGEVLRRYPEFAVSNGQLALIEAYKTRNRLSHGYDRIDARTLWDTAVIDIPKLIDEAKQVLSRGDVE